MGSGQPLEMGVPPHTDSVALPPTLTTAYFCGPGSVIIFPFDLNYLGEVIGEIKVISVMNENANHMIGGCKGRPALMCCTMPLELAKG